MNTTEPVCDHRPALLFFVAGDPVTQGSKTAFAIRRKNDQGQWYYTGQTAMHEGGTKQHALELATWRKAIVQAALAAMLKDGWTTADEPMTVQLIFKLHEPKKKSFALPATKPDLSKLVRAVEDALTQARVYHDDGRIRTLKARKDYAHDGVTGVQIAVQKEAAQ